MEFKPGTLVRARNRRWVVQPSNDDDLLLLKPLDGAEEETTGMFKPLMTEQDKPVSDRFPLPDSDDIGDYSSVRMLYDSVRFSFRNGAGPFRSFGKLSFRPRAFQLVPLIMSLRQETSRLLIADDVGLGKTVEALLIVKELLERRVIRRFAVVAPPHLCDQWARELSEKFTLDPVVIRSESAARLEKTLPPDANSVFEYYPHQVISMDYIKMDPRRRLFLDNCPELLVVDEAHTCASPPRADQDTQLRHDLIKQAVADTNRHLLMLTATPHSGFEDSFRSLLGFLNPEFRDVELGEADQNTRKQVARHFVQRRRADVISWLDEETTFPDRDLSEAELEYVLSSPYQELFQELLSYGKQMVSGPEQNGSKVRYWTALGLLRGVISSPAAGADMLRKRALKKAGYDEDAWDEATAQKMIMDPLTVGFDNQPDSVTTTLPPEDEEAGKLQNWAERLEGLQSIKYDNKLKEAAHTINRWLEEGYNPIVFCRYIATAHYVARQLERNVPKHLKKSTAVQSVTGELSDEQRLERVHELSKTEHRVLVATDCLSEGINLQDYFTAVLHYDLPWNPNKLEQREGRVDRFGQTASVVKTSMLYGKANPIDATVLRVLLRKARTIRRETGISVPFPEDSESIMQAVMNEVLLNPHYADHPQQLQLSFDDNSAIRKSEEQAKVAYERARRHVEHTRSIFAQHAIKPEKIEDALRETDQALGTPQDVQRFVKEAMDRMEVEMRRASEEQGIWTLMTENLPERLRHHLPEGSKLYIGFKAPLPEGVIYLGRNHGFVEQLSREMTARAFRTDYRAPARAAVIRTDQVKVKHTLLLLRVRNVIREKKQRTELIAEEMLLWGYQGEPETTNVLPHEAIEPLLAEARATENMEPPEQQWFLGEEVRRVEEDDVQELLQQVTAERTEQLIASHQRYQETIGGAGYTGIEPVLPPDIMGMYILLPQIS